MKVSFQGQTVFMTGAGRGIGNHIRQMFEKEGAEVIAPARFELDLSRPESISSYLSQNPDLQADIFVHCAGVNHPAEITRMDDVVLRDTFQVNCLSAVQLLRSLSVSMKKKKQGRILFISSLYAMVSKEGRSAYSASKNALTGLTKTLAIELGKDNILVNAIAPGYVMTDMTKQNLSEKEIAAIEGQIPLGRFQSEEDIANLTAFLCSELNQNITGQLIAVDGGFTCR